MHMTKFSKKEWIDFISSKLKSGSIEDFDWKIAPELRGEAFAHADDLEFVPENLANSSVQGWKIGSVYQATDLEHKILMEGVDSIYFKNIKDFQSAPSQILSEKSILIECNYSEIKNFHVHPKVLAEGASRLNFIVKDLLSTNPVDFIQVINETNFIDGIGISFPDNIKGISPVDSLADFLFDLSQWMQKLGADKAALGLLMDKLIINYSPSKDFIFEIAFMRALRILIYNLQQSFSLEINEFELVAFINLQDLTEGRNEQLIQASSAALSSLIGNANTIFLNPADSGIQNDKDMSRLCRNILLILKNESSMQMVKDPGSGSYAIESLSNKIATLTWSKLSER